MYVLSIFRAAKKKERQQQKKKCCAQEAVVNRLDLRKKIFFFCEDNDEQDIDSYGFRLHSSVVMFSFRL